MDKTDEAVGPSQGVVDREAVLAAVRRTAGDVLRTPLWRLPGSALGLDVAEVWLKLEHLQASGSFKARGMFNRLRSAQVPASGVVIASGGNAGIAQRWHQCADDTESGQRRFCGCAGHAAGQLYAAQ